MLQIHHYGFNLISGNMFIHGALWVAPISFDFLIFKFFSDRLFTKNTAVFLNATAPALMLLANFRKWWHHQLMDMSLSELWELGDRCAAVHGAAKSWTQLSNGTELNWTVKKMMRSHPDICFPQSGLNETSMFGAGWLEIIHNLKVHSYTLFGRNF